jgi:hypothetical protein
MRIDSYTLYSPFRRIFSSLKSRKKECTISIHDLREQWEKQRGICPYTGWKLVLPANSREKIEKTPNRASLDRIDSSKGYIKGNIQFVALMAQYAKHSWPDEDVKYFFGSVLTTAITNIHLVHTTVVGAGTSERVGQ